MPAKNDGEIDWSFLAEQVHNDRCLPFISNRVSNRYLFPDRDIIQAWATKISYPFADRSNLALVAQYLSVLTSEGRTRSAYLEFLKDELLADAAAKAGEEDLFLADMRESRRELTPTQLALDLGFGNFDTQADNVWSLLARLALPIYLTTSYHSFMEHALTVYNRRPISAVYCWSDRLERLMQRDYSHYLVEPDLEPKVAEPLVFHLYGIDEYRDSLVLNEDNFFEYIEHISDDLERIDVDTEKRTGLPTTVTTRLSLSNDSLLLLGYNLNDWDFRVAFHTAVQRLTKRQQELSLLVQFEPGFGDDLDDDTKERIRHYLTRYAQANRFGIYWGSVDDFLKQLIGALGV